MSTKSTDKEPEVRCRDECGNSMPESLLWHAGWEYLPIQNRYRCVECWRSLRQANSMEDGPSS